MFKEDVELIKNWSDIIRQMYNYLENERKNMEINRIEIYSKPFSEKEIF